MTCSIKFCLNFECLCHYCISIHGLHVKLNSYAFGTLLPQPLNHSLPQHFVSLLWLAVKSSFSYLSILFDQLLLCQLLICHFHRDSILKISVMKFCQLQTYYMVNISECFFTEIHCCWLKLMSHTELERNTYHTLAKLASYLWLCFDYLFFF